MSSALQAESSWFSAPLLRVLDERGKSELARAGRVRSAGSGELIYREGDAADSFFVVLAGEVQIVAPEAGRAGGRVLRSIRLGGSFGEEGYELGAERLARAVSSGETRVFEVPSNSYRRAALRCGAGADLEREERALARTRLRDRLLSLDLFENERALELLLDGGELVRPARGLRLFSAGDAARDAFIVLEGSVELLTAGDRPRVIAYFTPGDGFGHDELRRDLPRQHSAVPLGSALLLRLPAGLLGELSAAAPRLFARADRNAAPGRRLPLVADTDALRRTRLAVAELDRLSEARSLLSIDLNACVRCGHCSSACADAHGGLTRLIRQGDKLVARARRPGEAERALLLANSCQHCQRPSCLPECPTGAIGRGADGEVFIREELCTGCGACARACPWHNIQMAPRKNAAPLAVKCDLCSGLAAPACVHACPTEALTRSLPLRDFAEFSSAPERGTPVARRPPWRALVLAALLLVVFATCLIVVQAPPLHSRALALASGALAGVLGLALLAQGVRKRLLPGRASKRKASADARSRTAAWLRAHAVLGVLSPLAVIAHAGFASRNAVAAALSLSYWACAGFGLVALAAYRLLPRRLTRLERKLVLPENAPALRAELEDRLHTAVSGGGPVLKKLFDRALVPYLRSPWTSLSLLVSGRSLAEEEARLSERLRPVIEQRGSAEREAIRAAVGTAVELAARPSRNALERGLRGLGATHALLAAIFLALLLLHVVGVWR